MSKSNLVDVIKKVLGALQNVPQVGEIYDQQHSDTHMSAYLELKDAFEQNDLAAKECREQSQHA